MAVQIYDAAKGLLEQPPKLVEWEKAVNQTTEEIVKDIQRHAEAEADKKSGAGINLTSSK